MPHVAEPPAASALSSPRTMTDTGVPVCVAVGLTVGVGDAVPVAVAVTARPSAPGTVVWPLAASPQQAVVPSRRTAQAWRSPALTWAKTPVGGLLRPFPLAP